MQQYIINIRISVYRMVIVLLMEHAFKTGISKLEIPVCNALRILTSLSGHGVIIYPYFVHCF